MTALAHGPLPGDNAHAGERLRVALLSFDFPEYCVAIANALAETDDVLLMLPTRYEERMAEHVAPGVEVVWFERARLRQAHRQVVGGRRLVQRIRRFDADVLHVQQGHLWWNLMQRGIGDVPVVLTVHNAVHHPGDRGGAKTPEWVYRRGFRRADQLIVHSPRLEQQLREQPGMSDEPVSIVPHVVIGNEKPLANDVAEEPHTILFFGRIWPYKGIEHLIGAEPAISRELPDLKIVIAGRGEDFERYRRLMVHPERFEVHNRFVTNDERTELFMRSSVVVLPYVEASQSGVVHVAFALGKPVVATTVGALPETVEHGRTGLLVAPGDTEALAQAVLELLRDPDRRRAMGREARRVVETEASPATVAARTRAVYGELVARRGGGRPE